MYSGKLIRYVDERGFGFLALDNAADGERPVFVHITDLRAAGIDFPVVGSSFEYDIVERKDGKTRAVNLRAVE